VANQYAIVKKGTTQIRVCAKYKMVLVFDSKPLASKYLRRVKSPRAKEESEIVEVEVIIRRVK